MKRLNNAFSLMEMMVVLLIMSIIAAATAPIISKRMVSTAKGESPWVWSGTKGSIAYNLNGKDDMTATIGTSFNDSGLKPRLFIKKNNDTNPHIALCSGEGGPLQIHYSGQKQSLSLSTNQMSDNVSSAVAIGHNAIANKNGAIAIGKDSYVASNGQSEGGIAIGNGAKLVYNSGGIALGNGAEVKQANWSTMISSGISIGNSAVTKDWNSIAIGHNSNADMHQGSIAIGAGANAEGGHTNTKEDGIAIGRNSISKEQGAIALGGGATSSAENAIAIGGGASANASGSVSIGVNSKTSVDRYNENSDDSSAINALSIGNDAVACQTNTVALGTSARARLNNSIAIGNGSIGGGKHSISIGTNANGGGHGITEENLTAETISIGNQAYAGADKSIAIGCWTNATISNSGEVSTTNGEGSVAIGDYSAAKNKGCVAIGKGARSEGNDSSIAIGQNASALHASSVAIGYNAYTRKGNQIVLGTASETVYIPGQLIVDKQAKLGVISGQTWIRLYKKNHADETICRPLQHADMAGSDDAGGVLYLGTTNSDRRLKNVGEAFKGGLEEIRKLEVFNYTFKKDPEKTPRVGVIAQDLMKIFPNAVFKGEDGFYKVRMEDMFYALVNAVKELDNKVTALSEQFDILAKKQQKIEELENKISILEKQNAEFEKQNAEFEKRLAKLEKHAK